MKRDFVRLALSLYDRAINKVHANKEYGLLRIFTIVFDQSVYNILPIRMLSACYFYDFSFREKRRRWRCSNTDWVFHWNPVAKIFILPVWAGSLTLDTRWGCICKGDGPALLDHYSLPSFAHAHCWTWKMLSGSRLLSLSLRKMLSLTVSFFSPTRTPHLEEAHKIKIREIKRERGGP